MKEFTIYRIRGGHIKSCVTSNATGTNAHHALQRQVNRDGSVYKEGGGWAKAGDRYLVLENLGSGQPEGRVFTLEPPPRAAMVPREVGF